ncbi:MAG: hypothetical protein KJZ57_01810 [Anaerolineales bacterium]|nr:hypothetical protein [Anaerolineales bacterium]
MNIKVFFDCEFSDISRNAGLISIGLVAESDTEPPLYIEFADGWSRDECSTFVLTSVLPLLGRHNPQRLARSDAAEKIKAWLDGLRGGDREKQIVCLSDGGWDWRFLLNLFPLSEGELRWPSRFNIAGRMIHNYLPEDSGHLFNDALEVFFQKRGHDMRQRGGERHHALIDALALRHAWRVCQRAKE